MTMEAQTTEGEVPVAFEISKEAEQYNTLIASWKEEKEKVKVRRDVRENKKNVAEERQKGTILDDETIIPDRTVNTNIKRGRVSYLKYITQSLRLLIIQDVDDPKIPTETLELWFTRGMRFPKWKIPWIKLIDCVQTHGGAAMEVMYDVSKPFNCSIEYIPRDSLIFHKDTRDIQANPRLLRLYEITTLQLQEFQAEFGLDDQVVKRIIDRFKDNKKLLQVYRVLFKRDGTVYNAWYSQDEPDTWLRAPQMHNIGLFSFSREQIRSLMQTPEGQMMWQEIVRVQEAENPLPLSKYPIFWFPFDVTENEVVLETAGRTSLDIQDQEALTHVITNTVNATTRASGFYPCAENEPGQDPKLEELGRVKPGMIMSRKLTYWQPPWPNNIALAVAQLLTQRKAQESGNVDFASLARKDANKTATEMNLATQESADLSTTDLDVFSSPFLDTYALCFEVSRQQALYGLCKPPIEPELLLGDYNLSPAGDVEVTKRLQDQARAKEFFEIVRGTPLAEKLFVFLIKHYFPDEAADWIAVLNSPDKDQIILQLLEILKTIPTDELDPEQRSALQNVIIAAQAVVGNGNDSATSANTNQPASGTASSGNAPQQAVAG